MAWSAKLDQVSKWLIYGRAEATDGALATSKSN